jgi:hypothetical protein
VDADGYDFRFPLNKTHHFKEITMKKTKLNMTVASALMVGGMVAVLSTSAQAVPMQIGAGSTACMRGPSGQDYGCADYELTGTINFETGVITLGANSFIDTPFSIRSSTLYGPGVYTSLLGVTQGVADAAGAGYYYGLPAGTIKAYDMTVGAGQIGAAMTFAWGSSISIRVISLWNVVDDNAGIRKLIPQDIDGDGVPGTKMVDIFVGTSPVFTINAVPVPAAAWLFGSGLLGLVGVARRRNKASA